MFTPVIQLYTSDPTISGASPVGYPLTEHNRQPINISYEIVENSARMSNGAMRKYITSRKKKVSVSWTNIPTAGGITFTADSNFGAAWMQAFYEEYVYRPVWVKMTYSAEDWRQGGLTTGGYTLYPTNNSSFKNTINNSAVNNEFSIFSISLGAFSSGSSTASFTTTIPHNLSSSVTVYVNGVSQILNGTWPNITVTGSNTFTLPIGTTSSTPSAVFNINSYTQAGASAAFYIDSTDLITAGMTFSVKNSSNTSGSSINGLWTVVSKSSSDSTMFTASTTRSQTLATGKYGSGVIISTPAPSTPTLNAFVSPVVGSAVTSDIIKVFITNFTYNITHRLALTDYVDVSIEFTEI